MRTAGGIAFGTNGVSDTYDDSYALLRGSFGPDQTIEAVVFRDPNLTPGPAHEVELRLRSSDDNSNVRGYECLFNWYGGVQIFRWNGPWGDVVEIPAVEWRSLGRNLVTGDVVKASIVGSEIKLFINGVLMARGFDSTFKTGQPGIAFFIRPGGSTALLGLKRVTVTCT